MDKINLILLIGNTAFSVRNVIMLVQDKRVRGVSIGAVSYFTISALWGVFYFAHLKQWWSAVGILGVTASNFLWVLLAIYYERCHRRFSL